MNRPFLFPRGDRVEDPELPTLQAQLTVFAREVGELYSAERARSRQLQRAMDELRDTYIATMTSFAQVVEAKDRTTAGHLDRTQRLGLSIAMAVDPLMASQPETSYGFWLHDIGKVGIPEQILCKPGPLNPQEWSVMQDHPTIGANIVEPIRWLTGARRDRPVPPRAMGRHRLSRSACATSRSRSRPACSRSPIPSTR